MSATGYKLANGWRIDRGRNYELDRTATGTASIGIVDTSGLLDPTNTGGPFYGTIDPMRPAAIALQHPVTGVWHTLFRGYAANYVFDIDISENVINGEIQCVDGMDLLAAIEVVPDQVGDTLTADVEPGNVLYAAARVDDRIRAALTDAGIPSSMTTIFTGNVNLQDTVYAPRSQILAVVQDAADGEFPGVANFFVSKDGIYTFHGRLARFNPSDPQYGINHWYAGDTAAAVSGGGTVVPISSLSFDRDKDKIINAALSTPQNIASADISGQLAVDAGSIATYGTRTISFENLTTDGHVSPGSTTANVETKKFATYYTSNMEAPRNRINTVTFRPQPPGSTYASAAWDLMCGIEIGDLIDITTTHPGGGGFNESFFVEGIHYEARPLNSTFPDVTLTLDLSPKAYFDSNPFS